MTNKKKILCVGAAHFDHIVFLKDKVTFGQSNPAKSSQVMGGVGYNMASYFRHQQFPTGLISSWGADFEGRNIVSELEAIDIEHGASKVLSDISSSSYTAVHNPDGDLIMGIADIESYEHVYPEDVAALKDYFAMWDAIVVDSNLPTETYEAIGKLIQSHQHFCGITVSPAKAHRFDLALPYFTSLFLNQQEAESLLRKKADVKDLAIELVNKGIKDVFITMGKDGVVHASSAGISLFDAPDANVKNVTGAGDTFSAAVIAAMVSGKEMIEAVHQGLDAAKMILEDEIASNWGNQAKALKGHKNETVHSML